MTIESDQRIDISIGSFGLCQVYRAGIIQISVPLNFVERKEREKTDEGVLFLFRILSFLNLFFSRFLFSGFDFSGFFRFRIFTFRIP
jgi:hypothetical protein